MYKFMSILATFFIISFVVFVVISLLSMVFIGVSPEHIRQVEKRINDEIEACRAIGKPHVVPFSYGLWRLSSCELK